MSVIVGGSDLAAIYASGEASGTGGRAAVADFCAMMEELAGEPVQVGDSIDLMLDEPLNRLGFGTAPVWPDKRPSNPERED